MPKKFNPFREALKYLQTGTSDGEGDLYLTRYVCWCILSVHDALPLNDVRRAICLKAEEYVEHLIGGAVLVDDWLEEAVPGFKEAREEAGLGKDKAGLENNSKLFFSLQRYRKRWLIHMANQYDKNEINLEQVTHG